MGIASIPHLPTRRISRKRTQTSSRLHIGVMFRTRRELLLRNPTTHVMIVNTLSAIFWPGHLEPYPFSQTPKRLLYLDVYDVKLPRSYH